jgi:hypothetical protein
MEWDEPYEELERSFARRDPTPGDQGQQRGRSGEEGTGAEVIRLWPLRVLVVSGHEPLRAASTMLIGRRDCVVFGLSDCDGAPELVARERIDVVLVDGLEQSRVLAEQLADAVPPVGVVSLGEAEDVGLPDGPTLARWAPFEELFDALGRADRGRSRCKRAARR